MKLFIKLIILFVLACGIGYVFTSNNGHVSVYFAEYRYDFSLLLCGLLIVIGYVFFFVIIKLIIKIINMPRWLYNYRQNLINRRVDKMQFDAMNAYMDGDYIKAVRLVIRLLKQDISIKQRILIFKIGYLSTKLASLDEEYRKIEQYMIDYNLEVSEFIDFADMQINCYYKRFGLLNDNLNKVLATNKKSTLANLIKQSIA